MYLLTANAGLALSWAYLAWSCSKVWVEPLDLLNLDQLHQQTMFCIILSFLEPLNAALGYTRSKVSSTMLFVIGRSFIALYISQQFPDNTHSIQYLVTITCWALGELVRFSSFFVISVSKDLQTPALSIRYNVGPLMFTAGFLGEFVMLAVACLSSWSLVSPFLYLITIAWPFAWYSLFASLMRQRTKFYSALSNK